MPILDERNAWFAMLRACGKWMRSVLADRVGRRGKHGLILAVCLALLLAAVGAYPGATQETTTSPSCTGCSRSKAVKRPPRKAAHAGPREARPAVNNNGSWSAVATGPCIRTWRWSIDVNNGIISGSRINRTGGGDGGARGAAGGGR